MTPAMLQDYGRCGTKSSGQEAFRMGQGPRKKCTSAKPKADLLHTQGVSKSSVKQNSRALLCIPSWEELPTCTYSEPSHAHLPKGLLDLLKCCEEGSPSTSLGLCPVPRFFMLQWIDLLQCLYCEEHQCIAAGDHIWQHIARKHKGSYPKITKDRVLRGFLGHIRQCYPIIVSQLTTELKNNLPDSLPQPLSSALVIQRYKCPVQGCAIWRGINTGKGSGNDELMRHINDAHKLSGDEYESALFIEPQWTQQLNFGLIKKAGSSAIVIVPHDPQPDNSAFPLLTPAIAAGPAEPWTMELGWGEELKDIANVLCMSKEDTITKLRDLVELPSQGTVRKARNKVLRLVEQGLWMLNKLNMLYFSDVIRWISAKHCSFQLLFGDGRFV
jgi:hypothetical protein